jgi:LCP family protein required for cell wall assembly
LIVVTICSSVAVAATFGVYKLVLEPRWNNQMATDHFGNVTDFTQGAYEGVFTPPASRTDPFFMLLLGVDDYEPSDPGRSDTIILLYIHPGKGKIAMISIPRDLRVYIPGYGAAKINAAYNAGEHDPNNTGAANVSKVVESLAGVHLAYLAEVRFKNFIPMVDALGGVYVDVPVPINDPEAGPSILYPGYQHLDGVQALTFCRSRKFDMADYQRQANQRTFLKAAAKQILAGNPEEISQAIDSITALVYSNMQMKDIVSLAMAFKGINESDIISYTVPAYNEMILEGDYKISYEILRESAWRDLITRVAAGEFPDPHDVGLNDAYLGTTPASQNHSGTTDLRDGILTAQQCAGFIVDVRNGYGGKGVAGAVSDQLALAGYQQGKIANTNAFVYKETLIIYENSADRPVAEDILMRLGYGRIVASEHRYSFEGNVLVVVGSDFPH